MRREGEFPAELAISAPGAAFVYPTAGPGRGDLVVGRGEWTFLVDPPDEQGRAPVRVGDLRFHFRPGTCVHFDVNGDGLLERLDLSELRLTRENVDLEQSGGTVNVDTGDVTFRLVFSIDPREVPGLEGLAESGRISFDLTERGRFDLTQGRYRTDSDVFTVPDGPFTGLTVVNCIDKIFPFHSTVLAATVALGVCVLPEGKPAPALDIPAGQAPKAVWICPGTPIRLVWASTNADAVEITPDVGEVSPDGAQVIPDPASPNIHVHAPRTESTSYRAVTKGPAEAAEDHVTVNVIGPDGEWFSQAATHVDGSTYWRAYLPDHTYDSRILVSQVVIDGQAPDSITHPNWRLDHIYDAPTPVHTPIPALNAPQPSKRHPLPGEYWFRPEPAGVTLPPGEEGRRLNFRLFAGECGG